MTGNELAVWNQDLQSGDKRRVMKSARRLADTKKKVPPDWIFTRTDKFWTRAFSEMTPDIIDASGTDPRNTSGSATVKLKSGSRHNAYLAECDKTMVGVIVETAGIKMPYYVKTHRQKYENSSWTYTSELRGIAEIFQYLIIFPTWFLPIQAQPISHAVLAGPIVTLLENVIAECALRIQSGLLDLNNALSLNLDFRTWIGTWLQAAERDGLSIETFQRMLKTPMYVVRTNPFLDSSPLWAKTVRMVPLSEVIAEATQSYGIEVSIELWEVGDPQPDETANLDQPTYVVRVRDRTQITGPTKTIVDSVVRTTVDLGGALGTLFKPLISGVPGMEGVYVAPLLGVEYQEPWTYLIAPEPGEDGSVLTCEIAHHTQTGWQHIIGGKSPKWLNDLINAWFGFVIDAVQIVLGFTGIPSDLLSGFLNDAFFAFQMLQLYDRRNENGPYHPAMEQMHATGSAPYNVEALFTFLKVIWESRGWTSAQITFRNAEIYALGREIFKAQLFSIIYQNRTRMLTDYIENVIWSFSDSKRELMIQVGDGRADEPQIAKHTRMITALAEGFSALTLAPST